MFRKTMIHTSFAILLRKTISIAAAIPIKALGCSRRRSSDDQKEPWEISLLKIIKKIPQKAPEQNAILTKLHTYRLQLHKNCNLSSIPPMVIFKNCQNIFFMKHMLGAISVNPTTWLKTLLNSWKHLKKLVTRRLFPILMRDAAQKVKFSIKDFFSKCDQIRTKLRIWSHSLKKSLMENFIFCAVRTFYSSIQWTHIFMEFHIKFVACFHCNIWQNFSKTKLLFFVSSDWFSACAEPTNKLPQSIFPIPIHMRTFWTNFLQGTLKYFKNSSKDAPFKVNKWSTRIRCEICLKFTIKTSERRLHFYTPWIYKRSLGFLMLSRGYRNRDVILLTLLWTLKIFYSFF